jgi:uncharacterized repeat protein (TIGR01451 family)
MKKLLSFIASFSLLLNSFYVPAIAIAQELSGTPEPTPVAEETTSPIASIEATASPTENPTQEPTTEATPSLEPTVEPTETPVENPTPEPQLETQSPTNENSEILAPPTETPTTTPETIIETPEAEGIITTEIVENQNPFPVTVQNNSWFSLTTDKLDYAPTETAIITGSDFTPNKTYEITVSSSDDPTTSRTQNIKTDPDGKFVFYYQLDGIYRPNYKVEVKDAGFVVAETTFTDSAFVCQNDIAVNDYSGQRDLTRMCADYSPLPTTLDVTWNWDDAAWPGGNTGDACALFDTDSDGDINYALCITIGGNPATFQTKQLYSCGDDKPDRCTNKVAISSSASTICSSSIQSTDPFPTGDAYPNDTTGSCTLLMSDISSLTAELVDVCAYPSNEPNSAPSDCIIATNAQTGTLEIIKQLSPTSDSGKFNLLIDSSVLVSDIGHNGTTGEQQVLSSGGVGTPHTFGESAGTGTNLSDYTTSVSCVNATNSPVSTTGTNPWTVNVTNNADITCTITNTRDTGFVKVNKKVDFGSGFVDSNPGSFTWSLDTVGTNAMGSTVPGVSIGSHDVNENTVTDYHFVGWYPTASTQYSCASPEGTTLPVSVSVSANTTTDITLCNTINTGTIIVHKDVQDPNGEDVTDASNNFKVSLDGGTGQDISDDLTVVYNNVSVGSHTITESLVDTDYTLYGISQTQGQSGNLGGLTINVITGTNHVYVTNRQKSGIITVIKDVVNPDGGAVSDSHLFTVNLAPGGQSDSFAEGDNAVFTVNPGTYTASEDDDINYDELGCLTVTRETDIVVGSGESVTITCTNQQKKATIDVIKDVLSPTSGAIFDNHAFTAQLNGGTNQSFSETIPASYLVNPGNYSITELSDNSYDYVSCTPDSNQTAGDGAQVTVGSNGSVTVTCTNKQKNAQITVVKDVRDPNGSDVSDNTNFVVQRDGSDDKDFYEGLNATYLLVPGTYTFAELVTAGYTLNSINPDNDADVNNGTTVTLNSGQDVTITFTNYQNSGSILGQKLSDTDGVLGTTDDQTNLTSWVINLYTCSSDFLSCVFYGTDTTDGSGYSFLGLVPGYYQVREVLQDGWTALTSILNVTLDPGESDEDNNFANFENVSVTACKKVDADGNIATIGDQTPAYWEMTLFVDGQSMGGAQSTDRTTGCYTWVDLGPGHTYGVSEATPLGWTTLTDTTHSFGTATGGSDYTYTFVNFENASIVVHKNVLNEFGSEVDDSKVFKVEIDGTNTEDISEGNDVTYSDLLPGTYTISELTTPEGYEFVSITNGGNVTVASGQTHDVYVVNKQLPGSITIVKDALPNAAFNFGFTGDLGSFILDDDTNPPYSNTTTFSNLGAGTYSVTENPYTTWTLTDLVCVDPDRGTIVDISSRNATIDLDFGENITCTFTNSRRPKINIIKHVINDNGGTSVASDFTVNVTGENPSKTTFLGSESGTWVYFDPGSYSIDEIEQTGYAKSLSANCLGTLNYGNSRTCTITNDDIAPTLTLVKTVVNDNGGNKNGGDWVLYADGSDEPFYNWGPTVGPNQVKAGVEYTLSETSNSGYQASSWICTGGGTQVGNKITLALNEDVTCTITNDDLPGHLIVHKETNPANDPTGFVILLEGGNLASGRARRDLSTVVPVNYEVNAGTFSVSEDSLSGWDETTNTCSNIEVGIGETKECTITNTKLSSIQGKKFEDMNGDGDRDPSDTFLNGWTINLYKQGGGWEFVEPMTTGDTGTLGQYRFENLMPNRYLVCETPKNGWMQTAPISGTRYDDSVCFEIDLSAGQNLQGYQFGNFEKGKVQGMKYEDVDGDSLSHESGEIFMNNWDVRLYKDWSNPVPVTTSNTGETGQFKYTDLELGTYYACEVKQPDWAQTWPSVGDYPVTDSGVTHPEYGVAVSKLSGAEDEYPVCWQTVINSSGDFNQLLRFGNARLSSIHGYKWNDINGDGERCTSNLFTRGLIDTEFGCEEKLSGWTIELYKITEGDGQDIRQLIDSKETDDSEEDLGGYWFENLLPGTYEVCEVNKPGWEQTYPGSCHRVVLPDDNSDGYNFGNFLKDPKVEITKSNNKNNAQREDTVTYTLTLKNSGNMDLLNVKVIDALPGGFSYVAGTSMLDGLSISDPTISGNTLEWNIGSIEKDGVRVISYDAKISDSVINGSYKNLATCNAEIGRFNRVFDTLLFAAIQVDEVVETTECNIADSTVNVGLSYGYGGNLNGQVLGASIELPATGNPTWILIFAISGLIIGLFLKKKYAKN